MRNVVNIAVVLTVLTLAAAAEDHNSVVITFKDGHQQSYPLSDIASIQVKTPTKTTSVALPIVPGAGSVGHFLGKWKVGDGGGNTFYITLERDGQARKTIGSSRGTWIVENGEAHISWDDGWHDAIRKTANGYEKVAYRPGSSFSDAPDNVASAKSLEPI